MLRHTTVTFLVLGTLLIAGCSTFRFPWVDGKKADTFRARPVGLEGIADAEPPEILPKTYYAAAQLFEHQGLFNKAVTQYRHAIAADHEYVQAYHRLGQLLGRINRHREATEVLVRAVELLPDSAVLLNNLGFEYALQERWAEAYHALARAIELKPDFSRAHINMAMVLSRMGRYEEAFASLRAVLPDEDAFYNLGLMFRAQHRYADAAYAFSQVLWIRPDFEAARKQLDDIQSRLLLASAAESVADIADWGSITGESATAGSRAKMSRLMANAKIKSPKKLGTVAAQAPGRRTGAVHASSSSPRAGRPRLTDAPVKTPREFASVAAKAPGRRTGAVHASRSSPKRGRPRLADATIKTPRKLGDVAARKPARIKASGRMGPDPQKNRADLPTPKAHGSGKSILAGVPIKTPKKFGPNVTRVSAGVLTAGGRRQHDMPAGVGVATRTSQFGGTAATASSPDAQSRGQTMAATVSSSHPRPPVDGRHMMYQSRMAVLGKKLSWTREEIECLEVLKLDQATNAECAAVRAALSRWGTDAGDNPPFVREFSPSSSRRTQQDQKRIVLPSSIVDEQKEAGREP